MPLDCNSCGGPLLPLPSETMPVQGVDATFHLAACMSCGELTRSEVTLTVVNPG